MVRQTVQFFEDTLYDVTLVLICGGTSIQAERKLKKLGAISFQSSSVTALSWFYNVEASNQINGHNFRVIWWNGDEISFLVHELLHLVMNVFDAKDIIISWQNDEPMAYYIDFWTELILGKRNYRGPKQYDAGREPGETFRKDALRGGREKGQTLPDVGTNEGQRKADIH